MQAIAETSLYFACAHRKNTRTINSAPVFGAYEIAIRIASVYDAMTIGFVGSIPAPLTKDATGSIYGARIKRSRTCLKFIHPNFRIRISETSINSCEEDRLAIGFSGDMTALVEWLDVIDQAHLPEGSHPITFWPDGPREDWWTATLQVATEAHDDECIDDPMVRFEMAAARYSVGRWGYRTFDLNYMIKRIYYFEDYRDAVFVRTMSVIA